MGTSYVPGTLATYLYAIFFMKDRFCTNNMSIAYCSPYHMLADFFTKALQGALFVKLREVIMTVLDIWK